MTSKTPALIEVGRAQGRAEALEHTAKQLRAIADQLERSAVSHRHEATRLSRELLVETAPGARGRRAGEALVRRVRQFFGAQ